MDLKKAVLTNGASNTGSTIRGLQLFIADLRTSTKIEEQEKRIQSEIVKIKQHFNSASKKSSNNDKLGGYQRKKYVAKLAYIYITSNTTRLNDILFGLDQILELLKSKTFSEKFIAYMTLEMLYEHESVVTRINDKVAVQLVADLVNNNDDNVALALNFIGVVGRLKSNLSSNEHIITEVFHIIRSPTASHYLKKKASLSFLTLLKSNPTILTDDLQRQSQWINRILSLLDDTQDYRLMLSVLPLVEYIAKSINPAPCIRLIPHLAQILYNCLMSGLSTALEGQFSDEYKFANVPNPWLITKIVSLMSVLIVSNTEYNAYGSGVVQACNIDSNTLGKLRLCVSKAIELGTKEAHDPMEKIVQNTVLFSLINFASKLDPTEEATVNSVDALCSLLTSFDTNIRFLTLDSLVKLCSISGKPAIDAVRHKHLNLIFRLLNTENDSSIVRKIIDLLYTFTNVENVKVIVNQLFNYILTSNIKTDPKMNRDIAIKISVLTEKYATDINWFVEISLKLLSLSSISSVKEDLIWERLCQIVVNNPCLHMITCEELVDYISNTNTSEAIVKSSALLLGEYANLVVAKISIGDLFNVFADKYFTVSNVARSMILTTMIKLYKLAPEIGSAVIKFFQLELNSLDIELQTRSYEYLKLVQISKLTSDASLLDIIFAPLPPFTSKTNPLLKRLGNLPEATNIETIPSRLGRSTSTLASNHDSLGSDASRSPTNEPTSALSKNRSSSVVANFVSEKTSSNINSNYAQQVLSNNWKEGFLRTISFMQGILYSSPLLKILFRINKPDHEQLSTIDVTLTFINQTEWEMSNFNTEIIPSKTQDNPEYIISQTGALNGIKIQPQKRISQQFQIMIRKPFNVDESPLFVSHFKCGGSVNSLALKVGIGMTITLSPDVSNTLLVTLPQFVGRWKKLREGLGKEGEYQLDKINTANVSLENIVPVIKRLGFNIVEQTSIPNTIFVSGIIHTKSDGNFGCLLKIKLVQELSNLDITCKTTAPGPLAKYIVDCIRCALTN